jgi:hypothetical protein
MVHRLRTHGLPVIVNDWLSTQAVLVTRPGRSGTAARPGSCARLPRPARRTAEDREDLVQWVV